MAETTPTPDGAKTPPEGLIAPASGPAPSVPGAGTTPGTSNPRSDASPSAASPTPSPASTPPVEERRGTSPWIVALLAAGVVLFAALWIREMTTTNTLTREVEALGAEVVVLERSLGEARSSLAAFEGRMDAIKGEVEGIVLGLGRINALAYGVEPTGALAPSPAPGPAPAETEALTPAETGAWSSAEPVIAP